jgi:hypothetical protein
MLHRFGLDAKILIPSSRPFSMFLLYDFKKKREQDRMKPCGIRGRRPYNNTFFYHPNCFRMIHYFHVDIFPSFAGQWAASNQLGSEDKCAYFCIFIIIKTQWPSLSLLILFYQRIQNCFFFSLSLSVCPVRKQRAFLYT